MPGTDWNVKMEVSTLNRYSVYSIWMIGITKINSFHRNVVPLNDVGDRKNFT